MIYLFYLKKLDFRFARFLVLFFLMFTPLILRAATLESVVLKQEPSKTSIYCGVAGSLKYHQLLLHHPERLVIDFEQTRAAIPVEAVPFRQGLVLHLRSGHSPSQTLRLVFDLKQAVRMGVFPWTPSHAKQKGLRIDLWPQDKHTKEMAQTMTSVIVSTPTKLANKKPIAVLHGPKKSLRDVIIVLDPGHGGKDPGAVGPRRIAEKNVVLAIAYKLKQQIDKQPGMRAVLTRQGDYYVGLRKRMTLARHHNADIFISIHADAFINRHSNGASVFALSQTGATSEAARWLAEKENYSELGGVNLSSLNDQSGMIRTVLLDLSQTATITASLDMGNEVLHHLDKITSLHHPAVEQARFVVLKSPDIPSILIETGFITNPQEEAKLMNPRYQEHLTQAIVGGLKRYFWEHPPEGTLLEANTRSKLHIVQRGDSLPSVASYYHVLLDDLKKVNHLSRDRLYVGQKLTIPASWA